MLAIVAGEASNCAQALGTVQIEEHVSMNPKSHSKMMIASHGLSQHHYDTIASFLAGGKCDFHADADAPCRVKPCHIYVAGFPCSPFSPQRANHSSQRPCGVLNARCICRGIGKQGFGSFRKVSGLCVRCNNVVVSAS